MTEMNRMISRRKFLKSTALASAAFTAGLSSTRAAGVVNIRYFWRAAWPSSDTYANWLIDEWNSWSKRFRRIALAALLAAVAPFGAMAAEPGAL